MDRCINCMNIVSSQDLVCDKCGYDNIVSEPKKKYQLTPNTKLKNRFVIGLSTKSNSIFTTYIAYDLKNDNIVYIDELFPKGYVKRTSNSHIVANDDCRKRFKKAKNIIKKQVQLIADNEIVGLDILGAFLDNNTIYVVREKYEAKNLAQYMNEQLDITDKFARSVLSKLIKIMEPLHNLGIVNGSIRPSNIVLNKKNIVVTNFGFGQLSSVFPIPTYEGYSPLEQYKHGFQIGPKADIYSIATIYYAIRAEERPVPARNRNIVDTLVPLSKMDLKIKRSFENALLNALNIHEKNRTPSLRVFHSELSAEKTIRRWERVKAPRKRDFSFVKEREFWYKSVFFVVVMIMFFSLVGLMIETSRVKERESEEIKNRAEIVSEMEETSITTQITQTTTEYYDRDKE